MKEIIIMKKTILGAAVIAVVATSISTYAATDFQRNASRKGTQVAVEGSKEQVQNNTVGNIEYSKTTFRSEENGSTSVNETWLNPKTFDFREDINRFGEVASVKEVPETNSSEKDDAMAKKEALIARTENPKYTSTYQENVGKHIVNIIRDEKGNAVNGNEYEVAEENANTDVQDIQKNRTFAGIIASYTNPSVWKDAGTETTSDGQKLKKVSSGDINGEEMHLLYLNEDGLPVKVELYLNGKLVGVGTTEYKLIQDDGKIFDTSGVKLEKLEIK
jgi:hypothetical protein